MPLLRVASYNIGVNSSDKKKQLQLPCFFRRLKNYDVDLVMLQEIRPYVGQAYCRHPMVELALEESPYTFATAGNCSSGGQDLICSMSCRQFPDSNLDKYHWRNFSKAVFRHQGLVVTVINCHTRAGAGRNDTSDESRVEVIRKCREEAVKDLVLSTAASDLVFVAGDFNMLRPWKQDVIPRFEAAMTVPGVSTLFKHSAPDHLVCYIMNKNVQVNVFQTSPIPAIGKSHDGIGDHEGLLVDLQYSLPVPVVPKAAPQLPRTAVHAPPSIAQVIKSWESIGGGYLTLRQPGYVIVSYSGDENSGDAGWCYGTLYNEAGWFPDDCIAYPNFVKALSHWNTKEAGYLKVETGDALELIYHGTTGDERGWIFARCGTHTGWCPSSCLELWPHC